MLEFRGLGLEITNIEYIGGLKIMLKKTKTRWTQLKPIRKFSDILFVVAIVISLYTLISTTLLRNSLPPGVCPIDNKSEFYFLSIALLIASFVLSLFDKKGMPKNR